jgi:coproporphyrinogen III oxidase-like Fe-S oxidoreductase
LDRYVECKRTQGQARAFEDVLEPAGRARELLVVALRQTAGVAREEFRAETGFDYYDLCGEAINRLCSEGWLEITKEDALRLAPQAYYVSNAVFTELI